MDDVFEMILEFIMDLFGDSVSYEVDNWLQKRISNRTVRKIIYILICVVLILLAAAVIIALLFLIEYLWHLLTA